MMCPLAKLSYLRADIDLNRAKCWAGKPADAATAREGIRKAKAKKNRGSSALP